MQLIKAKILNFIITELSYTGTQKNCLKELSVWVVLFECFFYWNRNYLLIVFSGLPTSLNA